MFGRTRTATVAAWVGLWVLAGARASAAQSAHVLWEIGKADGDTREFALAPGGYARFARDALFVAGRSDARKDWPYVQPGPTDVWAGGKSHTFTVLFGLAEAPPDSGQCALEIRLVDTHSAAPPRLRITLNGHAVQRDLPRGAGDASVFGEPKKGRPHRFTVSFPARALRAGSNVLSIQTVSGSWVLYDALAFRTPTALKLTAPGGTVLRSAESEPVLVRRDGRLRQIVRVGLLHMGDGAQASLRVGSAPPVTARLQPGENAVDVPVEPVAEPAEVTLAVTVAGKPLASRRIAVAPVRRWVVYLLPHSHVDIGYTKVQTQVEKDHWRFYEQAIAAAEKTANYPPGAQFKWNVEVLWAVDSYLKQATPDKRRAFLDAVRKGWIGLDALYGNELTALCSQEELVHLIDFAMRLRKDHKLPIETAMISDVPGYTWGIVPVLAQAGVKYFSVGPNGGHRIGYTLSEWGDRPFWWVGPAGKNRILVWIPRTGYWRGFRGESQLTAYLRNLEKSNYPYDLLQVRHCLGDNAGPGTDLCEFVKSWNTRYAYPQLKIATTREMFHDFAARYGTKLPEYKGDFTPYWEDGAGSSARETALNRQAGERLIQAETLFALADPRGYPDDAFYAAWRNVVLYDEHTWGAHNSISQPDSKFARDQWKIKQAFALDADKQSAALLAAGKAKLAAADAKPPVTMVDVINTQSWPRTDLVMLRKEWKTPGASVKGPDGAPVPSQVLENGGLAFLARDVPALGAKRYRIEAGEASCDGKAAVEGNRIRNGSGIEAVVDAKTGAIQSLTRGKKATDIVNRAAGPGLNDYLYVAGRSPENPQRPTRGSLLMPGHEGPLVATLGIDCAAPGCRHSLRKVLVVHGLDFVEVTTYLDRKKVRTPEGVHLAFPFRVPKGTIRMDTPWAVVRPEADQLPGACKNYFTVQRWVDVSNDKTGVTWVTRDAPLIEIGRITCDPRAYQGGWIKFVLPTQTFLSYVMNNYWETNYKADQEGPVAFRYWIRPHGPLDVAAAQRFAIERTQPLVVVPARGKQPVLSAPFRVAGEDVLATCFKPSRDRSAWIVRLRNASAKPRPAALIWPEGRKKAVFLSNFAEDQLAPVTGPIELQPMEFVTLRIPLASSSKR